ncbi:MAG: hypothetical protein M3Q03_11665 [Chloroflexota bacterium]|nr:hypothetical protein [Chloroflexota bacterium]
MGSTVTTPQDFWRLAQEAERRGIRILVVSIGEHCASLGRQAIIICHLT